MRPTRWLLAGVAVLVAGAVAVAWLLPSQLDSERFRAPLQRLASRTLGVQVRIDGPIRLRLLPQPVLEAGSLSLLAAGAAQPSLTAQGMRLHLVLADLLAGRIEAKSLLLYRPDLRLPERFEPRMLLGRHPGWIGGAATRIKDGRIESGGRVLAGIDARIEAEPLTGDLAASGTAGPAGHAWEFAARLTQPGGDGAAGIELSLTGRDALQGTGFTLSGQIAADGGFQGHGAAHGPDLGLLLPVPPLPFVAEGRVSVADGLAEADDLSLQLGGDPARGAVALRLAPALRLDVALAASRLPLDPWVAVLLRRQRGASGWGTLPIGVDLSAEAGLLAGGTVRGLRAAFDLQPAAAGPPRLGVRELRATLPGDAALRLIGTAAGATFAGEAALTAATWPVTQAWLAPMLPARLGGVTLADSLDLRAHLAADATGVRLDRIAGTLDGATVSGALAWRQPDARHRAQLAADLTLQRLRLAPWLAADLPPVVDLALRVRAREATWRGLVLAPFLLDLDRQHDAWALHQVRAGSGGMLVTAAGRMSPSGRLDGGQITLDARSLAAIQTLPGAPALPLPSDAALLAMPLHVQAQASGTRAALSASVAATLGELAIGASPRIDLDTEAWVGPVTLRHPSARGLLEASGLATEAGLPLDAGWLGEGNLALSADCTGRGGAVTLDALALSAGSLRMRGTLRLGWEGVLSLSGHIEAETLPLPPAASVADAWLSRSAPSGSVALQVRADSVTQGGLPLLAPFAADIALADALLRVTALQAGVAGGTLGGSGAVNFAAAPPRLQLRAALEGAAVRGKLTGLPVDITAGRLSGQGSLTTAGHSTGAMLAALQGEVSGQVLAGSLAGVALAGLSPDLAPAAVSAALSGGATAFDRADLALRLDHGLATLTDGRITLPAGTISLSGSEAPAQQAADLMLTYRPTGTASPADASRAPPAIGLRLLGGNGRVQRIPQLAALAQWQAAREQP